MTARISKALAASLASQQSKPPARSKYGSKKTIVDGVSFHSAKEAKRYSELKLMERAGEIAYLTLQPRFPLRVNGELVCTFVGDFSYHPTCKDGVVARRVVEDVKGYRTPIYRIKSKLFRAVYGFPVTET